MSSLLVMGSVAIKDESVHRMHYLDFQHQHMTTGSVETGFCIYNCI